jgi:hypothetical protein
MKKRQILSVLLVCLLIVTLFAGCSKGVYMDAVSNGEAMAPELSGNNKADQTGTDVLQDRKLIRKIHMSAETEDMDALLAHIDQRVGQLEGYIEARDIYNGSAYYGSRNRSATLTIRIPADKLDGFVQQIGEVSNIISNKETSDDVTLQYTDMESRLKVLRTEEERLLAFMEEAKSVSEMLEIEKRLTEVQAQLDSLTSQLKVYDNLVDYGTIYLSVEEVEQYTEVQEKDPTMWQRISTGFVNSAKNVWNFLKGVVVVLIVGLPYLALVAVAGIAVWLIIRRKRKK